MSHNELSLLDLREGGRVDPITPLIDEDASSNPKRNRTNVWGSWFHIARTSDRSR